MGNLSERYGCSHKQMEEELGHLRERLREMRKIAHQMEILDARDEYKETSEIYHTLLDTLVALEFSLHTLELKFGSDHRVSA
jgi:hypothetical protein